MKHRIALLVGVYALLAVGCMAEAGTLPPPVTAADVAEGAPEPDNGFTFECWTGNQVTFQALGVSKASLLNPMNVWELTEVPIGISAARTLYYTPKPGELCGVG